MPKLQLPLLILHGMNDRVVPYKHGERLFQQASNLKTFVSLPEAGHSDLLLTEKKKFDKAIKDFLISLDSAEINPAEIKTVQ